MTTRLEKIAHAVAHVRRAKKLLREAGCGQAADYLARAQKSVEGAQRHAFRMESQANHYRAALAAARPITCEIQYTHYSAVDEASHAAP